MEKDELSPDIFSGWKEELEEYIDLLNERRSQYANKYIHEEEMFPWDEEYVKSQ